MVGVVGVRLTFWRSVVSAGGHLQSCTGVLSPPPPHTHHHHHHTSGVDASRRGSRGGGAGSGAHPWTEGSAPKAQVPSSQGQKEGTLVSLAWLFNTIQTKYGNKHLEKLQICVCVCEKSLIPIPYKVINPLAPSPGRNPGSAPGISAHRRDRIVVRLGTQLGLARRLS